MADQKNHRIRGIALAIVSSIAWGFSGCCGQFLSQEHGVSPLWISCARLCIGGLIVLFIALLKRRSYLIGLCKDKGAWPSMVPYVLFGVVFLQLCYLEAIAHTNSGVGTLLEQFCMVIVMFASCVMARRLPRKPEVIALCAALLGIFFVSTHGDLTALHISPEGLAWGLSAALMYALYMLLPAGMLNRWGSVEVTALSLCLGAIVALLMFRPWEVWPVLTPEVILGTCAMIVFGTVFAYLCFLQAIKDAGPIIASLLNTIELVAAMGISAVWLGTEISAYDILGLCLIVAMVFLVTLDPGNGKGPSSDGPQGD